VAQEDQTRQSIGMTQPKESKGMVNLTRTATEKKKKNQERRNEQNPIADFFLFFFFNLLF
jgi:hypothetical protein